MTCFQDYCRSCCVCHHVSRSLWTVGGRTWYSHQTLIFAPRRGELICWLMARRVTFCRVGVFPLFWFYRAQKMTRTPRIQPPPRLWIGNLAICECKKRGGGAQKCGILLEMSGFFWREEAATDRRQKRIVQLNLPRAGDWWCQLLCF